ncbi:hypothetical protein [Cupriavidus sp. SS-3]|uniref:hypothetical protein n=1 Tax=Cupriavidus sp. SS-3 TaxID=3109596 RepID=UPI002DBBE781|nr:hypothetical protein [Cupriavidus sp. SS-3]MEC3769051.1 hypothetical protein [Cupriavidus sp. SS-3]
MSLSVFIASPGLRHVEPVTYNRGKARCPLCRRDLHFGWLANQQVHFGCDTNCPPSDILRALGLTEEALHPEYGEYRPFLWDWQKDRPRYAAGPIQPQAEQ